MAGRQDPYAVAGYDQPAPAGGDYGYAQTTGYAVPRQPSMPTTRPTTGGTGYFFSDPIQQYVEGAIRKRIGDVQNPMAGGSLPSLGDFQGLQAQFGAQGAAPGPSSLDSFKQFVAGFNPTYAQDFNAYAATRDPNADVAGFQSYAAGRNPLQTVDQFRTDLAGLGPNTSLSDLQNYVAGRNPSQAADTLSTWLTQNSGVPQNYLDSVAQRVQQLRGNPFDDTQLAARRTAAFGDIEQARQQEKQAAMEQLAARGVDASSGLADRAMRQIDQRYDAQRSSAQNALTQEEFNLRESHQQQADQLESQAAQLQMNATQFAGQMTGQIAQLQQQGLGMNDAIAQSMASLGMQDRAQQQQVITNVAQLTQQGYQMQDALQIAITNAGLQAKAQADNLRAQGAQFGLQQSGMLADVQNQLAGLGVQERGQDMNLAASNASLNANNLMNYLQLQQQNAQYQDQRNASGVDLAMLLDQMASGGLTGLYGTLPTLR